jgi:hypothetical protein
VVPVGPGETIELPAPDGIQRVPGLARWWPDGSRLMFAGRAPGRPARSFVRALDGSEPTPLTPEGVVALLVAPDGRRLLVRVDGKPGLFELVQERLTPIRGLAADDQLIRWSGDGRALFVSREQSPRTRELARVDLPTGRRQVLAAFGPSDAAGLAVVSVPVVSGDGRTWAYRYQQVLSDLFVATGLR